MQRIRQWALIVLSGTLVACRPGLPTGGGGFDLNCTIPAEEIYFGGVARDGIPALTDPHTVAANQSNTVINDEGRVLGVVINGEARAYPMVVLWYHEIINDHVGGDPVLISYCPLTGSGIAFDPVVRGEARNFGVSGLLFENNLMMFDRATESLWNQMSVGATCGPERGRELNRIPVTETTWGAWQAMHPNSRLVSIETNVDRPYGLYPYGDYALPNNSRRNFPGSGFSNERPPKELVLGVFGGGTAVAYPFGVFENTGEPFVVMNDTAIGRDIVIAFDSTSRTAIAFNREVDGQLLTFHVPDPSTGQFEDLESGSTWDLRGVAVAGSMVGQRLDQLEDAYVAFWFAWSVYFPDLRLVEVVP